ncbi:MAG TPA: tetratricopeptide repeat protein [Candidatus Xenobia bacterium]
MKYLRTLIVCLTLLAVVSPVWADSTLDRALGAFYAKNYDEATVAFKQALSDDPLSTFALVMWLETAHRQNKLQDVATDLEGQVDKKPNDANLQAQLGLADMYLSSEKMSAVTRGQAAFDKALTLDPNCAIAHSALGLYYFTSEKVAKAKNQLSKAVEVNPRDIMAHERLAEITMIEEDKPEISIPMFKDVVKALPNYPDGWFFLGMAQEKSKKQKDAITSYERSIALDPFALTRSVYARVRIARLYQDAHRKDLAVQVLQDLIKQRPDFKDAKQELSDVESGIIHKDDDPPDRNVQLQAQ